jgi:hypothetical protein
LGSEVVWAQQDTGQNGVFLAPTEIETFGRKEVGSRTTMGDSKEPRERRPTEEIIAAFDRERAESQELNRRHTEKVRAAHADDRQSFIERRRRPR